VRCEHESPTHFTLYVILLMGLCVWLHFSSQKYSTDASFRILLSFLQNVTLIINFPEWTARNNDTFASEIIAVIGAFLASLGSLRPPLDALRSNSGGDTCPFRKSGFWGISVTLFESLILLAVVAAFLVLSLVCSCCYFCCSRLVRWVASRPSCTLVEHLEIQDSSSQDMSIFSACLQEFSAIQDGNFTSFHQSNGCSRFLR